MSQPFNNEPSFGDYQYLNTTFVLQDIYTFIQRMDKNEGHHGPWIIEGLGYAGSIAAWYQHMYPNTGVSAVWASSAPL